MWRGIIALMNLCGGDGIADLVGKRFHKNRLPYNPAKTVAGSISVFAGGWLLSALILALYVAAGVFQGPVGAFLAPLALIALACTLVESLPLRDVDNITVTVAAAVLGYFLF